MSAINVVATMAIIPIQILVWFDRSEIPLAPLWSNMRPAIWYPRFGSGTKHRSRKS